MGYAACMSEAPNNNAPIEVHVKAGESYWWCSCGKSASQPFCDGSHKGTDFVPQEFKPETDGAVWFCACKKTQCAPTCDGSHKS